MTIPENLTEVEQADELDWRWSEHLENPGSAIPWDEVGRKLQHGK